MVIKNASLSGFSRNYEDRLIYSSFFFPLSSDLSLPLHIDYHRFWCTYRKIFTCYTAKKRKAHLQDNAWHITINKSAVANRGAITIVFFAHRAHAACLKNFLTHLWSEARGRNARARDNASNQVEKHADGESFAFLLARYTK